MRYSGQEIPRATGLDARFELARILDQPLSTGAIVSGPIGSAKTALLDAALGDELLNAVRLLCSPVLGENNFGALSPLLIDFEKRPTEVNVLRYLSHLFTPVAPGDKPLVVVEEAHYLDSASAFVLTQLVQAGRIKLILLAVGVGHTEPVVTSTELGARLGRISLGYLSVQEVAEYAQEQLGGRVTSATAKAITSTCAGNPLLINAFLRSAQAQEFLVESKGWHMLTQSRVNSDVHLAGAISEIQKRLDHSDAKALEILALGGAESAVFLEEISGADIGRLLGTGLVKHSSRSRIEVAAPIYSQVLREIVPPGRSLQLWREVTGRIEDHGTLPNSLLWACESGDGITFERFVEGITYANDKLDFHTAWRLCRYAGCIETEPRIAFQGARAMMGMQRYQTVAAIVDRAYALTTDFLLLRELKSLETAALWRGDGTHDEISQSLQSWKSHSEQLSAQGLPSDRHETDRNQRSIEISELWVDLVARRDLRGLLTRAQSCQANCQRGSLEFLMCRDVVCKTLMSLGHFVEAADMALDSVETVSEGSADEYVVSYQLLATAMRALFAVGDYAKMRAVTALHEPKLPELFLGRGGMLNFWAAFASIQEGRWHLAGDQLDEACAELAVHDPDRLLVLAEALCDFRNSQLGTNSLDNENVGHERFLHRTGVGFENPHAVLLAAAYRHVSRNPNNLYYLETLIERAHVEERFETEQQLLLLLWQVSFARQHFPGSLERLGALCMQGSGRRSSALADAVRLVSAPDPSDMVGAAGEVFFSGETGLGAELLASALNRMDGIEYERQRGVVLRKLAEWVRELGGTPWGLLRDAMNERTLTNRENEIIQLVSQGLSNREIARALTVSQRTVEGHLYRVFAKLGISGRDELNGQF